MTKDQIRYQKTAPKRRAYALQHRRALSWAQRALTGQNKRGRDELSIEFLSGLQVGTPNCACCKKALSFACYERGKIPLNFATLDRVIPSLGYVPKNVAIVCLECNRLKDRMTLDDAKMVVAYIEQYIRRMQQISD